MTHPSSTGRGNPQRSVSAIEVLCREGLCALSVSAVFLIQELDRSFEGLLQVSSTPLRTALAEVGR